MENLSENVSEDELSDDGLRIVLESPKRKMKKSKPAKKFDPSEIEMIDGIEKELDETLDAKAAKVNLTTTNVKSILRQVVTNEHVLALVRQSEDPEATKKLPFEPKLTRAKAKQLFPSSPSISSIPWVNPTTSSDVQKLITDDLAEDSSGDEYVPAEEESEDDPDVSVCSETEVRSISPPTPAKEVQSPDKINWTDDGIFKIPPNKAKQQEEEANIALRTRSKLCLSSTPLEVIEEAFIPPDITTDMYDMDCDDDDWRDFLKKFTRPLDEVTKPCEDEEQDPEYNILADEEVDKVDKEELRADKAVKVSRKELNDMLTELFEYANNFEENQDDLNGRTVSLESQPVDQNNDANTRIENVQTVDLVTIDINVPNIEPSLNQNYNEMFKLDQKLLLEQQMRQQVQLLTQNFLLSYQHPEYHSMSVQFKEILCNYKYLSDDKEDSFFKSCNLEGSIKLIEHWETQFQLNTDEMKEVREYVCKVLHESQTSKTAGIDYVVTFPPLLMETISKSEVFIYPDLLPIIPFKSSSLFTKRMDTYTTSEDQLIALGLENLIPILAEDRDNLNTRGEVKLKKVCGLIRSHVLPTKDMTKLYCHVFNSRNPRSSANPIKYYFEHKRAPVVIHYVRSLEEFGIVPPCKRRKETLPYQWKLYLYPETNQQTTPQLPPITKVQRPPTYNKTFTSRSAKRRILRTPTTTTAKRVYSSHSNNSIKPSFTSTPQKCDFPKRKLEQNFSSPKTPNLDKISSDIRSLKFNSSIFRNLHSKPSKMLPSMPFLDISSNCDDDSVNVPNCESSNQKIDKECNTESDNVNAEGDDEEETVEKDNEEDINALMVASSTIKSGSNRRSLSGAEKKRLKLRKEYLANLSMLSPEDPSFLQEKAQSYAQAYFDKAKERLKPEEYSRFTEVLNHFDENSDNITELYKKIESIIGNNHTDLMEEFLTFLTPSQAKDIGKLIPYYIISNMSLFLRKLEIYFKDQPAQLRKIYRSLTELTTCVDVNMERVKSIILPLLKGNRLLTDWFLQIFPSEPPPPSLLKGVWEQIDARREFNSTDDIFETITVPEMEDQYGGINCICSCHETENVVFKSKSQHCIPCGIKFFQGRVYIQTGKGLRLANVTFTGSSNVDHNLRLSGLSIDKRKRRSEVSPSKQFTSPTKEGHDEVRLGIDSEDDGEYHRKRGRISKSPRKKKVKFRDVGEKVALHEPAEPPVVYEENFNLQTPQDSEIKENLENGKDPLKPEDGNEWDCNTSIESIEIRPSSEHSAESESEFCEESSQDNINTETDDSAEEMESSSNSPVHSDNSNSNNVDEETCWTRDEDKIILETLQKEGGKDEAFVRISEILRNRSVVQIKERFHTLMHLLQKMTNVGNGGDSAQNDKSLLF